MGPWWSEGEFKAAMKSCVINAGLTISDADLDATTSSLLRTGIICEAKRFGIRGYVFTRFGVEVSTLGRGH